MANRHTRRTTEAYSTELPEGVGLRWAGQFARFQLYSKGPGVRVLAERRESEVLKWKNPERVFASVARRALGIKTPKRPMRKEEDG